jgi:RNA polymerase sigma-70 factor (ECF subfamily)
MSQTVPPHGADPAAAQRFAAARPRLLRLAYSQLGDLSEAEDVVQDAWLRLTWTGPDTIRDLDAWLTTVVGRLALDVLRSARVRRESYVGPWLPEPVVEGPDADPADRVTLDESVSFALLAVLEQLSPAERTAFVLHDVFDVPFAEVAEVVGRSPDAVRQLASRARRHVAAGRPRRPVDPDEQARVVAAFARATAEGDIVALLEVLDPDAVFTADGGGIAPAARKPLYGAQRIARAWLALRRKAPACATATAVTVNGLPGLLLEAGTDRSLLAFTVDGGRIVRIDVVRNPAKLARYASTK